MKTEYFRKMEYGFLSKINISNITDDDANAMKEEFKVYKQVQHQRSTRNRKHEIKSRIV